MLLEKGLEVDYSTVNRWALAYATAIERLLSRFHKPHRESVGMDETYIRIRGSGSTCTAPSTSRASSA